MHVLYNIDSTIDYLMTWPKGPIVEVRLLNGLQPQYIKMMLKFLNSMSGTLRLEKMVEVVQPKTDITIKVKGKVAGYPNGTINLEEYLDIKGDVIHASLNHSSDKVKLIERIRYLGEYRPPLGQQGYFNHIESYGDIVIGVHTTIGNNSMFTVFQKVDEFVGTCDSPHGVSNFHFAPLNSDNYTVLIAYSTAENSNNSLQLIALKGAQRVAIGRTADNQTVKYTKIRVVPLIGGGDRFGIFALNSDTNIMTVYLAEMIGQRITITSLYNMTDVHRFTYASPGNTSNIYVYYVSNSDRTTSNRWTFSRNTLNWTSSSSQVASSSGDQRLSILSIECRNVDDKLFYCLNNMYGTKITEAVYDSSNPDAVMHNYTYFKLPGYEGWQVDGNSEHFVMMASQGYSGIGHKIIAFKRQYRGGSGDVYYTRDIDQERPFTLTTCRHGMSHLQVATHDDVTPLVFLEVTDLQLKVTDASELKGLALHIDSSPGAISPTISMTEVFGGPSDKGEAAAWWPFVLILVLLVMASVAYLAINNLRSSSEIISKDQPTAKYTSVATNEA